MSSDIDKIEKFKFLKETIDGVIVSVRIVPNSSNDLILGYTEDYLKIKISSPPVENKANKQLILFLSKFFKLPKTKVSFVYGEKSKIKRILLGNLTISEVSNKILIYDKIDS